MKKAKSLAERYARMSSLVHKVDARRKKGASVRAACRGVGTTMKTYYRNRRLLEEEIGGEVPVRGVVVTDYMPVGASVVVGGPGGSGGTGASVNTCAAPPDAVNHPPHYGGKDNPYEAIKVIEAWKLGYNLGNAVAYIARAGKKDPGKLLEDLEKARWSVDREIARLRGEHERAGGEAPQE